jgi:sugar (pentulose or hexulose) kinase
MSSRDLFLAIDVGTGSVRAALVDTNGNLVAFQAKEHDQIVLRPGWAEQRPRQWWEGAVETTRARASVGARRWRPYCRDRRVRSDAWDGAH